MAQTNIATIVNRIRGVLQRQFRAHISMDDWAKHSPERIENAFLSRAIAALCVKYYADVDAAVAANSIVDGAGDCGIDAIFFDETSDTLLLIQSKWSSNANVSFDEAASIKFANGVRKLLAAEFSDFNEKVRSREGEIREFLYTERHIRICIITAHTAKQRISDASKSAIDRLVNELNDPVNIADHIDIDQGGIYSLITDESRDAKIKLQAVLNDWGVIEYPFLSYYGRVGVDQIACWWKDHKNKLFSQNLRLFYQRSDVNEALRRTIIENPEYFWYFNNGITIIADRVVKGLAGAPAHKFANFTCEGASVVNGAQTVGTIGLADGARKRQRGTDSEVSQDHWVQVRLISLEGCPADFARRITRATNLQNAVGNREFAAMDPLQHQLALEFALDKRRYVYKSGEFDPHGDEGCSIVEATQALACSHSVRLAVEVKREIGSLWADTERAPYTEIFHKNLTAEHVWKAVAVMRTADEMVQKLRHSEFPRADLVGTHLSRIILHLVFQAENVKKLLLSHTSVEALVDEVSKQVDPIFEKVAMYMDAHFPGDYLANFAKNAEKCERLVNGLNHAKPKNADQISLFDFLDE